MLIEFLCVCFHKLFHNIRINGKTTTCCDENKGISICKYLTKENYYLLCTYQDKSVKIIGQLLMLFRTIPSSNFCWIWIPWRPKTCWYQLRNKFSIFSFIIWLCCTSSRNYNNAIMHAQILWRLFVLIHY